MNPEQYAAAQAAVAAGVASYVQRFAGMFTGPVLSPRAWLDLLALVFPEVQRRYAESAVLGRDFYDAQRARFHPQLPRNDRFLTELSFDQFVENMAPARKAMSQADSPKSAVSRVALSAVREVEMAARRQVIGAVKDDSAVELEVEKLQVLAREQRSVERSSDTAALLRERFERAGGSLGKTVVQEAEEKVGGEPSGSDDAIWEQVAKSLRDLPKEEERVRVAETEPDFVSGGAVIGWARVATGAETCAWCLMLISRGAELNHKGNFAYSDAAAAGLNLDDGTALELWEEAGGDVAKFKALLYDDDDEDEILMEKWHTGCDCLAVPVFDINNWPGREAAKRAQQLWIDASLEASDLIESGEARSSNKNRETLNALRRRLERGEISMSNYAFAA